MKKLLPNGQALITLLFFTIVAITVTSAAVVVILSNSQAANTLQQGVLTHYISESGAENALLRLLRNPSYTGETLNLEEGTIQITVTGENPKIITSTANQEGFIRTTQIQADYTNDILTVDSWREVF